MDGIRFCRSHKSLIVTLTASPSSRRTNVPQDIAAHRGVSRQPIPAQHCMLVSSVPFSERRVKSSTIARMRKRRPSVIAPDRKSRLQRWLGPCGSERHRRPCPERSLASATATLERAWWCEAASQLSQADRRAPARLTAWLLERDENSAEIPYVRQLVEGYG
jgi:hypothetical protein